MLKKIFLFLFLSILITNCNYSPVYMKNENFKYNINITEIVGDNETNKYIVKDLNQQSKVDAKNNFDIKINTTFTKKILAKDSKGTPTDFELKAKSMFIIGYNNIDQVFNIEEKLSYKKLSNNYEQSNYEKTIKKNIASSIARKLILRLATLND